MHQISRSLIDRELRELLGRGLLSCPHADISQFVQPASIDLPLGPSCVLVREKVLPHKRKVRDLAESLALQTVDLTGEGGILLRGQTYLAYCGKLKMPGLFRGSLSPKSSIGRVDLMVRGVFDQSGLYDTVAPGEDGELWMEISPRSFNIRARQGQALSQMMVFSNAPAPAAPHPAQTDVLLYSCQGEPLKPQLHGTALVLSLGLNPEPGRRLGWEALPTNEVVDLAALGTLRIAPFFRPLTMTARAGGGAAKNNGKKLRQSIAGDAAITLEKDKFYILATKERIRVPTHLSAEMIPFSHHIGELRAHYAGFFDPGFGAGRDGALKGTVGVLEVRPHETITIYDGQPICLIDFFVNTSVPDVAYGDAGNNYQAQRGPKLAKFFQPDDADGP
jgi:dCTP deaminase